MNRWAGRAFLAVSLLVIIAAAFVVPMPGVVETPGSLLSLGGCIDIESPRAEPVAGDYLLTTVNVRRATVADLALARFDDEAMIDQIPVLPGETDRQYFARQRDVFAQTAQRAAALGLAHAGFAVDPETLTGEGAIVLQILDDSPADGVLRPGDVIVEVEGQPVRTSEDLQNIVGDDEPLQVRFLRDDEPRTVELTPQTMVVEGESRLLIGVVIETYNARIELPVPVDVESGGIGGPSAGLMIALTVYDKVSGDVDLASGRRIAGTGTVDPDGVIGRIGGIALKALSAHRDDADVFLAPTGQARAARSGLPDDSGLEVLAVDTFDEAVDALRRTAPDGDARSVVRPPRCPFGPSA